MKKRLFAILACCLSLLMLLSACGEEPAAEESAPPAEESEAPAEESPENAGDEPVTITYCNFNSSGGNEETLQRMYEAFHEEYPNITVEIETIAIDDYFTQMQTRVAGGTNFSNVVLVYNKDLFDQAGIGYPTSDWTQDDVQAAAEAIHALGDDIYGYYQPLTYNEFYKACAQFGGSLLNEDKTAFTINAPENVAAAQMMADRVLVTNVQPTAEQMGGMGDWDLFMSGRLGMIPTGIWAFNTFAEGCDFDWDIAIEPGEVQKATHFFSNACVVNADSENKDAAMTWITWLCSSPAAAEIRIEAGWDLPAVNDEAVLASYLDLTPPENREAVFESLDYLVVPPVIEDYALMSDIIGQQLEAAAAGTVTVQEALDEAQAQCEAQISLG